MPKRKRSRSITDVARMGGKARIAKLNAAERSALARKGGLANADRMARLKAMADGFHAMQQDGAK